MAVQRSAATSWLAAPEYIQPMPCRVVGRLLSPGMQMKVSETTCGGKAAVAQYRLWMKGSCGRTQAVKEGQLCPNTGCG